MATDNFKKQAQRIGLGLQGEVDVDGGDDLDRVSVEQGGLVDPLLSGLGGGGYQDWVT